MRNTWRIRLKALLLTVVLLGGGGSMPVLDALLYHQRAAEPHELQVHVEGMEAQHHADACALGWILPVVRHAVPIDVAPRFLPVAVRQDVLPPRGAPPAPPSRTAHPPRAPPSRIA